MYVPAPFALNDLALQHEVIRAHPFGLIVTGEGGAPTGTHLPFELDAGASGLGTLRAHFSRANDHWRVLERDTEALVVFAGPHAYVSPSWYPEGPRLPTWNYVTVHVTGTPRLVEAGPDLEALLSRLVARFEPPGGWSEREQSDAFLERMRRGVVAFEMPIERIEGKAKLGQNHSRAHREGAAGGLRASGETGAAAVADWMQRQLDGELD